MSDSQENSVSVRVPEWVMDEIEEAIKRHPRPRPTRGELLTKAWSAYVGCLEPFGESAEVVLNRNRRYSVGQPPDDTLTEIEVKYVEMLLNVLRSMKPGLSDALKRNCEQFHDLAKVWDLANVATYRSTATHAEPGDPEEINRRIHEALRDIGEAAAELDRHRGEQGGGVRETGSSRPRTRK